MTRKAIIVALLWLGVVLPILAQADDDLGYIKKVPSRGKHWAILIGVNYTSRQKELREANDAASQKALPALANAARDAWAISEILVEYYEYDKDRVIVLTDDGGHDDKFTPTEENISAAIARVRREATDDDTLLLFFAGHGLRLNATSTTGNNVALLPLDVELKEGQPVDKTFNLPFGLLDELENIKAHQKLLILDCCYSGEIFNQQRQSVGFQPTSALSSRNDESLQRQATFQAMASCRASQTASDGVDGNSRFTSALLHALRRIPAQTNKRSVTSHQLLNHVQGYLDESQRPDCRNLVDRPGEFCFKPQSDADFSPFLMEEIEEAYLRSMVVSRQGSWWFQECPWFIPSIRAEMVQAYDRMLPAERGPGQVDLLNGTSLRQAAEKVLQKLEEGQGEVVKLRLKHCKLLLEGNSSKKLMDALEEIEVDLDKLIPKAAELEMLRNAGENHFLAKNSDTTLQAADVHLLAVVKHALGKSDAEQVYKLALDMYAPAKPEPDGRARLIAEAKPVEKIQVVNYSQQILRAICRVDYAELLQTDLHLSKAAAEQYQFARAEIRQLKFKGLQQGYADFFLTFNLVREADGWLAINRWKQANALLDQAKLIAERHKKVNSPDQGEASPMPSDKVSPSPVTGHFLHAHVYRRDAWAKMMQWQIEAATCSFQESNRLLLDRIQPKDAQGQPATDNPATQLKNSECEPVETDALQVFSGSADYASQIAYLHNLHGIAMGIRFQGNTREATQAYRSLVEQVEAGFNAFSRESVDPDFERQFINRAINTQERLGDCNLLGDPDVRDLKEAFDDYRRAMLRVHLLRDEERDLNVATLLYKQALALSLRSLIADHELAKEMCGIADQIYLPKKDHAMGLFDALGTLSTLCVHLCEVTALKRVDAGDAKAAQRALREALLKYRDKIGTTPHRDELELCLFASNILLKHGGERSKYEWITDADLLLGFCRIALSSSQQMVSSADTATNERSDSIKYLRQYFDTAMEAKMRLGDSYVKELLQIQREATLGRFDVKNAEAQPILALYILNEKAFLIIDIPKGSSRCVSLADFYYSPEEIRKASLSGPTLTLPEDIQRELADWLKQNSSNRQSAIPECRWIDPVRGFPESIIQSRPAVELATGEDKELLETSFRLTSFPFKLPERESLVGE